MKYILALDQGTTSTRAVIYSQGGGTAASYGRRYRRYIPRPAWWNTIPRRYSSPRCAPYPTRWSAQA